MKNFCYNLGFKFFGVLAIAGFCSFGAMAQRLPEQASSTSFVNSFSDEVYSKPFVDRFELFKSLSNEDERVEKIINAMPTEIEKMSEALCFAAPELFSCKEGEEVRMAAFANLISDNFSILDVDDGDNIGWKVFGLYWGSHQNKCVKMLKKKAVGI